MRPFNLQQALVGAPLVCRNGAAVKDFHSHPSDDPRQVLNWRFTATHAGEWSFWCTQLGEVLTGEDGPNDFDLFMVGEVGSA